MESWPELFGSYKLNWTSLIKIKVIQVVIVVIFHEYISLYVDTVHCPAAFQMTDFKVKYPNETLQKGSAYLYRWILFCKSSKQLKFSALHDESNSVNSHSTSMANYLEFTTVCHVTDLKQARRILEDDVIPTERQLLPQWLETKRVRSSVIRLVPNTEEQVEAAMLAGDDCPGRARDVKFVLGLRGDEGILKVCWFSD